jgi:hypothetical protein
MTGLPVVASPDALGKAWFAVLANVSTSWPVVECRLRCLLWVGIGVLTLFAEEVVQEAVPGCAVGARRGSVAVVEGCCCALRAVHHATDSRRHTPTALRLMFPER